MARISPNKMQRWRKIAIEACRQSGRRVIPELAPVEELPAPAHGDLLAILLEPAGEPPPLADLLREPPRRAVWLAVGPESGFSRAENRGGPQRRYPSQDALRNGKGSNFGKAQ